MEPIPNGGPVTIGLVTLTITTPATAINGGNVPTINPTTGTVVVPENTLQEVILSYTKSVIN
jgi:hypothetical protein